MLPKYFVFMSLIFSCKSNNNEGFTFQNAIRFPFGPIQGPFIGLFLAISVPLELPHQSVFFSYNIEANYNLPQNQSMFTYPPLLSKRSFSRKSLYEILEYKLKSHGYPKNCLLRMVCEAAQYTMDQTGVLGDIFHILLTPSSSIQEDIPKTYYEAEEYGKNKTHCKKYTKKCSISIIGLFSLLGNFLENKTR